MKFYTTIYTKLQQHPSRVAFLLLCFLVVLCLAYGSTAISFQELWQQGSKSSAYLIVLHIRIPRVLAGLFCGMALSLSGLLLQHVLNNPLASPSVIGINAGAGFFVALGLLLFPSNSLWISLSSFLGAFLTCLLLVGLSRKKDFSTTSLILAGLALSGILSALLSGLKVIQPDLSIQLNTFFIGTLANIPLSALFWPCLFILMGTLLVWNARDILNILQLGDVLAYHLGVSVNKERMRLLFLAALLAGSAVSICGLLGFVGLLVPHVARLLVGSDARKLIPLSALLGASFVLLSDLISRLMFAPFELPVGILLSICGGLFFLYLLNQDQGGKRHAGI
ncbi:MAG: FecCD family ABC transporter permease [Erysipelotrichaceae bacterium]